MEEVIQRTEIALAMIAVCPRCDAPLVILTWEGLDVDVCPLCQGIWLDHGELEALLESSGARTDDPLLRFHRAPGQRSGGPGRSLCPRCDSRLMEVAAGGLPSEGGAVQVEKCTRGHGLWFDRGELMGLLKLLPAETGAGGTLEALARLLGTNTAKSKEC